MVGVNRTLREEVTFEFTVRGRTVKGDRDRSNLENLASRGNLPGLSLPFYMFTHVPHGDVPLPSFLFSSSSLTLSPPLAQRGGRTSVAPEEVLTVGRSLGFK